MASSSRGLSKSTFKCADSCAHIILFQYNKFPAACTHRALASPFISCFLLSYEPVRKMFPECPGLTLTSLAQDVSCQHRSYSYQHVHKMFSCSTDLTLTNMCTRCFLSAQILLLRACAQDVSCQHRCYSNEPVHKIFPASTDVTLTSRAQDVSCQHRSYSYKLVHKMFPASTDLTHTTLCTRCFLPAQQQVRNKVVNSVIERKLTIYGVQWLTIRFNNISPFSGVALFNIISANFDLLTLYKWANIDCVHRLVD